jgi:hypothetical protein
LILVPIAIQTVWILGSLGAAVFAARSTGFGLCLFVLGFAAPVFVGYSPAPEHVGTLAALSAGISLFHPRYQVLASLLGGAVAGCVAPMILSMGAPTALALIGAATIPAISLLLARNPRFAPGVIMEEALLLLFLLGLGAALVPPILEGWRTAAGMNAMVGVASQTLPAWVLLVAGASLLFGSAWSAWRSR